MRQWVLFLLRPLFVTKGRTTGKKSAAKNDSARECVKRYPSRVRYSLLTPFLNGRAWDGSVGTENATISRFWSQHGMTSGAFVKKLTCVGRHGLFLLVTALRAGDYGSKFHGALQSCASHSKFCRVVSGASASPAGGRFIVQIAGK